MITNLKASDSEPMRAYTWMGGILKRKGKIVIGKSVE